MGLFFSKLANTTLNCNTYCNPLINTPTSESNNDNQEQEIPTVIERNCMFSNINHKKKALIIGINYIVNTSENDNLNGCVNDMVNILSFLKEKCFFVNDQIKLLENGLATKTSIIDNIKELVDYSNLYHNSELWFSYSGHGTSKHSFFEEDNKSEVICPSDYQTSGFIDDTWLKHNFICKLHPSTKLFVLMDCCNSGSNMNLPYCYKNEEETEREYKIENELCNVIKISGCRDDQTSADYFDRSESEWQGALTNEFLKSEHNNSFIENISILNNNLKERRFGQRPVLSFSIKGSMNKTLV